MTAKFGEEGNGCKVLDDIKKGKSAVAVSKLGAHITQNSRSATKAAHEAAGIVDDSMKDGVKFWKKKEMYVLNIMHSSVKAGRNEEWPERKLADVDDEHGVVLRIKNEVDNLFKEELIREGRVESASGDDLPKARRTTRVLKSRTRKEVAVKSTMNWTMDCTLRKAYGLLSRSRRRALSQ